MWKKLSSGKKVASGLIHDGKCMYFGFTCVTGAVNRTVTLYDSIDASGKEVEYFVNNGGIPTDGHPHGNPVVCSNGLYLEMSGGTVIVWYAPYNMNT